MNARSCQLCGKPLSRWSGGDGDFCSKEHRNQFRLRAGMDRLVEVNKVASLMRRRESARPIPTTTLICRGLTDRHDYGNLIQTQMDPTPRLVNLRPAAQSTTHVVSAANACKKHGAQAARGSKQSPRMHPRQIPIVPGGAAPIIRTSARGNMMTTSLPRHDAAYLPMRASDVARDPHQFAKLPAPEIRTDMGSGPAFLKQLNRAWDGSMSRACSVRTIATQGKALRVSMGQGFRVPAAQLQTRKAKPVMASSLPATDQPMSFQGGHREEKIEVRLLDVKMPEIAATLPEGPETAIATGLTACEVLSTGGRILRDMPDLEARESELRFPVGEPAFRASQLNQSDAGFAKRNGTHMARVSLKPNGIQSPQQVTNRPFVAREDYCVPTIPYCNVLAAATPSDGAEAAIEPVEQQLGPVPVPPPQATVVRFEESFDAGWDNWVGGVSDWKVDIAGVRTGSLALYVPTLDLTDYELEFLARIDTRSVNWVVRAAGAESHVRCTVTLEDGQLRFSHALVQGGNAETPVVSGTTVTGKPRATFTVRMSVSGPVFSISIDGKMIDSWVDDRLATGGVGFLGAADDRARLYWVRVASPGTPGKEHKVQ